MGQSTWADSAGSVLYNLQLSSGIVPGVYQVKLSSGQITGTQSVTIISNSGTSTAYTFTAQTDKSIYQGGDTIQVTGYAQPNTSVTAVLQSATGSSFTSSTTASSSGSYTIYFATTSAFESGTWTINVTNLSQTKITSIYMQTSGSTSGSHTFTAQTDKTSYNLGDTIQVSGTGQPSSTVTAQMTGPSGSSYSSSTTVNSAGSYTILFSTSSSYPSGSWNVYVSNLGQSKTIYFTLGTGSSGSYPFTAQTDKSSYNLGDMIQVTGVAQPSSTVTAVMTSPSGATYTSSTNANSDGTYTILFSTTSSYQTGNWNVNVSNLGQSKTIYFTLGTGSSSGSSTFTAQTSKSTYSRGDLVQVAGNAPAGSTVSATFVSPSQSNYPTTATSNSNGNYVLFFSTTGSYPTGTWYINVSNNGQSRILTFTLQ